MPHDCGVFAKITALRARVLREIAEGWTAREAAERLGMTLNGFRSHVADVRGITGQPNVRELARWWRAHRTAWALFLLDAAGVTAADLECGNREAGSR